MAQARFYYQDKNAPRPNRPNHNIVQLIPKPFRLAKTIYRKEFLMAFSFEEYAITLF